MSSFIHYTHCPACNNTDLNQVFSVKDYTVSQKEFAIVECPYCTLRFTQDVPNEAEIGDYYKSDTYVSHTNTSKGFINSIYKQVRKRTLIQKKKLVETVTNSKQGCLLDVGAGTGAFVQEMQNANWQVTGLEPDSEARDVAKKDFGVLLLPIDEIEKLSPASFDAITMWHVLEHVHDLNGYMQRLKSLLRPGGKLIVAVPNYTSYDAEVYQQYWAAYDVPRHLYHFSPKAMCVLAEKHGLKVTTYKPMWFDSYYVSMLSTRYKTGSMKLFNALIKGFKSNKRAKHDVGKCSSVIYIISAA